MPDCFVPSIRLTAVRTVDRGFPAFIAAALSDAHGTVHELVDKSVVLGIDEEPFVTFPLEFTYAVTIDEDRGGDTVWIEMDIGTLVWGEDGRRLPGTSRFEVQRSQIIG